MKSRHNVRPTPFVRRILGCILLCVGASAISAPDSPDVVLQHADQIKLSNNDQFQGLLKQLDVEAEQLSPTQRDWLDYFHAWQLGYQGEYPQALAAFETLLARTQDTTIRTRSRISLLYDQVNAAHYEAAYTNINNLLDSLPQVKDHNAHFLILLSAAYLYGTAGQYDLVHQYLDQALAYDSSDLSTCIVMEQKAVTLSATRTLQPDDPQIHAALNQCLRVNDPLDAYNITVALADANLNHGNISAALKLLNARDADVVATHSSALTAEFRSKLAYAYLRAGDLVRAEQYAHSAIEYAKKQEFSKPVADAYQTLYQVAKKQGDPAAALLYHEKYATADKGYLNDTSARALAYQMVHQQVQDKKRQIEVLSEQNQLLALKQQVDRKSSETRMLYIMLLFSGLVIVVGWAYRTKRSQIKFQKLARRDGLTGISNRQHFFETAQEALRYCAKSSREASVLALDLDHFKSVNDMHGHAAGDAVLKRMVAVCREQLRSIDLFGRLGGEEFAILLPDCNAAMATHRANEMRIAIAGMPGYTEATSSVVVTASIGIATSRVCGYNLPTLLAHADTALYAAKHAGRNHVSVHGAGAAAKPDKRDDIDG
ncbi:MAG TPA: diguanylate cyclase [Rudaea sp.]|nr:diguanylate cyclase [Rudaea sp.]